MMLFLLFLLFMLFILFILFVLFILFMLFSPDVFQVDVKQVLQAGALNLDHHTLTRL